MNAGNSVTAAFTFSRGSSSSSSSCSNVNRNGARKHQSVSTSSSSSSSLCMVAIRPQFLDTTKTKTRKPYQSSASKRKNVLEWGDDQAISLVDITWLKPHEQISSKERVQQLYDSVVRCDAYIEPLLVDSATGAILDGHHRYAVGRIMDLKRLPAVLVDYLNDDSISLDMWPGCGVEYLTKEDVVAMSMSEDLYPPKTSRHNCVDLFAPIHVPLSYLI